MYSNYHRHSYYSNIITPDSPVSNRDYALRAVELGHKLISGVEHGWAGRYIEGYELSKEFNLKFLFGLESYIVKDRKEKDKTNSHLILLAKNENGRKNINRILSEANLTGFYYKPRIDFELLFSLPKNDIWVTTACVAGVWKYDDYEKIILDMYSHFGNNLFLEVQNHNTDVQKNLNQIIVELSNRHSIPIIFGCDSHYINYRQSDDRDDYLLSKHITYEDENGWYMDYPDDDTVQKRFEEQGVLSKSQIQTAIENTNTFLNVEEYTSKIFNHNVKLPSLYPEKTQEEKNKIFSQLIWTEWEKEKGNVAQNRLTTYETEIQKEESVVIETGMADYFLLDYEVVKRGKELGGHITMTGRGSAPSFYISKLLGFTTIDRIAASVKLFPERFITKERILDAGTLPDIDFNLSDPTIFAKAQTEILGENHSYPMVAYGTLQPKAAWKLYARAKSIDFETANHISSQIEEYEMDLKHVPEDEKESLNVLDYIDEDYRQLFLESEKYLGIVSDAKIHPCAYLLFDENIKEEIGLLKVKENLCCVMDGLWAEKYKMLKNDLLKVSVVDLIYRVYERIGIEPHPLPELIKLCHNNQKVWEIYKNAWTMGVNQVEQKSTSGRVSKYAPQNISELSAFVAAIRPGFKSNYKQFQDREPFSYGIESLDNLLQTKEFPQSYMLYQEQSMQVMAYAGIPISVTYDVVKNIAKKRVEKVLKYKEQFIDGMTKKVMRAEKKTEEESNKIAHMTWQIIEDSSRYSFNSSHSYSVAGDSLYGAYLKSHYPLEFYETFLKILEADGDKDRLMQTKEEAQHAYRIMFPPIKFGQDNRQIVADKEKWQINSSLTTLKGFPQKVADNLWEISQKREYTNFFDLLTEIENCGMMSKKIEELIRINYFDCFGGNKKLLNFYQEFTSGKSKYSNKHIEKTKQKRLEELEKIWNEMPDERMSVHEQIEFEKEILGYIQATYPVDKRYVYVLEVDEKYAPRVEVYNLYNGKRVSLKIQKKVFQEKIFFGGEIIFCKVLKKKPSVKMEDGKFVDIAGEYTWWLESWDIVDKENFDKIAGGLK